MTYVTETNLPSLPAFAVQVGQTHSLIQTASTVLWVFYWYSKSLLWGHTRSLTLKTRSLTKLGHWLSKLGHWLRIRSLILQTRSPNLSSFVSIFSYSWCPWDSSFYYQLLQMSAETYGRAVNITFASFSLKQSMNDCDKDYLRIGNQKLVYVFNSVCSK